MDPLSIISDGESEENDAFLGFVEYSRSMLASSTLEDDGGDGSAPSWSWIVSRILKTCIAYSSGVTPAILLSDLFQVMKTLSPNFPIYCLFWKRMWTMSYYRRSKDQNFVLFVIFMSRLLSSLKNESKWQSFLAVWGWDEPTCIFRNDRFLNKKIKCIISPGSTRKSNK